MPQLVTTLAAGVNFDGTFGKGLFDIPAKTKLGPNDTQRIRVLTFSLAIGQGTGNARLRDVVVAFAQNLEDARDDGNGYLFVADTDIHQFVSIRNFVIPTNWSMFVFANEATGGVVKTAVLDYHAVTLRPYAGGGS